MIDSKGYVKLKRGRGKSLPLYQQISQHLTNQIQTGEFTPGDRLPSVSQMVKHWKVDYKTVNLALEKIESEGLIRLEAGRGKGPIVIGKPVCDFNAVYLRWNNDGYPLGLTEGIQNFAEEKGMNFSIADVSGSYEDFINTLSSPMQGIDGIIVIPQDTVDFRRACQSAIKAGARIVFVDQKLENVAISSVAIDHLGSAHQVTGHLLASHKRPAYCLGVTKLSSIQLRLLGWSSAMREYNFHHHDEYILETPLINSQIRDALSQDSENNYNIAKDLFSKFTGEPLSIFTCNGAATMGVYKAAAELNLTIGQDVFVAGFGDSPECKRFEIPFSFVQQNWDLVGYEAAKILFLEMMETMKHPMHRLLPTKLQIQQSSIGLSAQYN